MRTCVYDTRANRYRRMTEPTNPDSGGSGADSSGSATASSKYAPISINVDHPFLLETDGESIRIFLRKYDQH